MRGKVIFINFIYKKSFRFLIAVIEIILLWWICSILLQKDVLPSPWEAISAFGNILFDGSILPHLLASLYRVGLGTLLGLVLAIPTGILLGYSKNLELYFGAAFDLLYTIPKVVFLPIIIVLLGIGDLPKVVLIGIVLYFQQTIVIRDRAKSIPENLIKSIKMMGASRFQEITHLVLPYCVPDIMTSLRATLGTSIALLFIAENFASIRGLGYFVTTMMGQRDYPQMYAGIIMLALMGWILYYLIGFIEKLICKGLN